MPAPQPTVGPREPAVYAPHMEVREPAPPPPLGRELTFFEALREAHRQEMERDQRVFVMGEDVGLIGGIFAVTRGLREQFGDDRVRDTPISEATFLGTRSEEHTSELQSRLHLVCRLLLEKKKKPQKLL